MYLFRKINFRLDLKIAQTLLSYESNEELIPEQNGKEAANYINPGCGASDLGPVHGERSQMRGKYESQDHMHSYQDREKLRRPHEAEAVGNAERATHQNQQNDMYHPTGPPITQLNNA